VALEAAEYELATVVAEGGPADRVAAVLRDGGVVLLDTGLDAELEAEGFARDVVRAVQDERKSAGLQVSDRIALTLRVLAERLPAVQAHRDLIAAETLALELTVEVGDTAEPEVMVRRVGTAS
jgi:isoleucyl-tRNA synthetase